MNTGNVIFFLEETVKLLNLFLKSLIIDIYAKLYVKLFPELCVAINQID